LNLVIDQRCLSLSNRVGEGGRPQQNLEGGDAPLVSPSQQLLGDDGTEGFGEHGADLLLFVRGEGVDDPIDGLGGRVGVQRSKNEQAGLGRRQRHPDRLEISHLADEETVRIFANGRFDAFGEIRDIGSDLALGEHRAVIGVYELDGILDGDDVKGHAFVDAVEDGGQGG